LSYPDVLNLYASCDVYVSLHRAEGLGLGLMESMLLGKPVIATGWSGNMTFMNRQNSFPIDYHLMPVKGSIPNYRINIHGSNTAWAQPDINDAVTWMERLACDQNLRTSIGRKAEVDLQIWQNEARQGKFVDELQTIWEQSVAKRDELKFIQQWETWRAEGQQLFFDSQEIKIDLGRRPFYYSKMTLSPLRTRLKKLVRRIKRTAQKTRSGRWVISYLSNRKATRWL
jgi:hypothetical protein